LIVAAGHVRPYKGTMTLLAAWQQARRPAGALLVVVGESYLSGPERRQVADAVSMDRTVLFIDRYVTDEELVSFLNRAEALVLPYLSASQSGMLAIARAIGLPCIATSAGGLAEQAAADGEINEIVASGDVRSLAEALERRLAQPRGQRAVITEETFRESWQRVVEAIGIEKRP
jgi:glycosyltransferase involved in cell wall biosynthesis